MVALWGGRGGGAALCSVWPSSPQNVSARLRLAIMPPPTVRSHSALPGRHLLRQSAPSRSGARVTTCSTPCLLASPPAPRWERGTPGQRLRQVRRPPHRKGSKRLRQTASKQGPPLRQCPASGSGQLPAGDEGSVCWPRWATADSSRSPPTRPPLLSLAAVARAVAMNAAQFAALALAFELGSDAFAAFKAKHAA